MNWIMTLFFLCLSPALLADNYQDYEQRLEVDSKQFISQIKSDGSFEYLLYLIEYGNQKAIQFTPKILAYSDAAMSEAIKLSLARAISRNPEAVMQLVPENLSLTEVCNIPFIEAPDDIINIHINQAISSLISIDNTDINNQTKIETCLKQFIRLKYR